MEDSKQKAEVIKELEKLFPEIFEKGVRFSINQFKSKKNLVYDIEFLEKPELLPKSIVVKYFKTENAEREYNLLEKLKDQNIFIPEIVLFRDQSILFRYETSTCKYLS